MWEQRLGNHTPTAVPSGTLPPWLTVPTRPALSNNVKCNKEEFIYNRHLPSHIYWKLYMTSTYAVFVQISGCEGINICLFFVCTMSSWFYLIYQQSISGTWALSKLPLEYNTPWSVLDYVTESDITFTTKADSFCALWLHHIGFPMNKTFTTQPPKVNHKG